MTNERVPVVANYWLHEARDAPGGVAALPLEGRVEADVAIVGGGYTGMWTAYALSRRAPGTRVVLLEQGRCGEGPSGRNGGFVHGWWEQLPLLVELFGTDTALALAAEVEASVDGIAAFCAEHGVDAWFRRGGYLRVSTARGQDGEWRPATRLAERLGRADQYHELTAAETRARCDSPRFRGAALMTNAATVQPARLALGLRRVLGELGVQLHEQTRVLRVETDSATRGVVVRTDRGQVRAAQAVLALNAWAAGWPGFRTSLLTWGSWIALSDAVPERLAEIGWTGGEAISDSRFTVRYFRTTPDGRIAFGSGVGAAGFGGRIDGRFERDDRAVARTVAGFRHLFPMLADVPLGQAWGGPIDVSPDRLPVLGTRAGGRVLFAHGFTGNGVAPAHLAGRILAARIATPDEPLARVPLMGRRSRPFPPEPVRFVGARLVREALIRLDDAIEQERRPSLPLRAVAGVPRLLGYRLGPGTVHRSDFSSHSGRPGD